MRYKVLNASAEEIRVVCLHPRNRDVTDPNDTAIVHCHIEHRSLLGIPEYCALSYAWGDPQVTTTIVVDGEEVQVTTNLEAALRQLRDDGNFPVLWVDALCINQADKEEKSDQVRRMGFIYSRAKQVVAWVGLEADCSSDVIAMVETVASKGFVPPDLTHTYPHVFEDLDTFFGRPYFFRLWIRQEMSKAKEVIVYCGGRSTPWDSFVKTFAVFTKFAPSSRFGQRMVSSLQVGHAGRKRPITLLEALVWTRGALASDPRDRFYSLLGLCEDGPDIFPVADYTISLEDLCKHATKEILLRTHYLDVLRWRSRFQTPQECRPTWIPDWIDLKFTANPWDMTLFDSLDVSYDALKKLSYVRKDVYAYYNPVVEFRSDILKVRGRIMDIIDGLTSACLFTDEAGLWTPTLAMKQSTVQTAPQDPSKLAEQLMKCLISEEEDGGSTLTWSRNLSVCFSYLMSKQGEVIMKERAPELWKWFTENSDFKVGGRTLGPFGSWGISLKDSVISSVIGSARPGPWAYERAVGALESYFAKRYKIQREPGMKQNYGDKGVPWDEIIDYLARSLLRGMRLVTTHTGHFGLAHMQSQPGDKIVSINGCMQLLVLRDAGNGTHNVIGGANIRGGKPTTKQERNEKVEADIFII